MTSPKPARLSFTQISLYIECPYKRHLVYDKKLFEEKNAYMFFGTAIDEAITTLLMGDEEDLLAAARDAFYQKYDLSRAPASVISSFHEIGKKISKSGTQLHQLWEQIALEHLTKLGAARVKPRVFNFPDFKEPVEIISCQECLEASLTIGSFIGYIDVVAKGVSSGKLYIIDIKTAGRPWSWKKAETRIKERQLLLYKHFYAGKESVDLDKIETWYLFLYRAPSAKQEGVKLSSPSGTVKMADRLLEGTARMISEGFRDKTTDTSVCNRCHLREGCHGGEYE